MLRSDYISVPDASILCTLQMDINVSFAQVDANNTDSSIHVGITGTDVDIFATAFDLDGASVGDHTPAITSSGVCSNLPVFTASADTIDVEIHASGGTITGGIIRVYAVCVMMDDITQSTSANEVDRDLLA